MIGSGTSEGEGREPAAASSGASSASDGPPISGRRENSDPIKCLARRRSRFQEATDARPGACLVLGSGEPMNSQVASLGSETKEMVEIRAK